MNALDQDACKPRVDEHARTTRYLAAAPRGSHMQDDDDRIGKLLDGVSMLLDRMTMLIDVQMATIDRRLHAIDDRIADIDSRVSTCRKGER